MGGFFDFVVDNFGDKFWGELLEGVVGSFVLDDFGYFFVDSMDLGRSGIGGFFDLVGVVFGESDGEEVEEVVVGGLDGDVGFD